MRRDEIKKMACRAFDRLIEGIEAGKSKTLQAYLKAMARFHQYSAGNAILIALQRPDATRVAGFRAWQRLGRHVKKGEHGIAIMAPVVYRRKAHQDRGDEENAAETVCTFKTAYVFDVAQTDGKPLPEFARTQGDPGRYLKRLERFIEDNGIKLRRSDSLNGAEGVSTGSTIILKSCLSPADAFSVLCHELAHLCSQFGYVSFI